MDLRLVTARLLQAFGGIGFAPGEDGTRLLKETVERFTVGPGSLKLVLREEVTA